MQPDAASLPPPASRATEQQILDTVVKLAPWAVPFLGGGLWRWWQARRFRRERQRELVEAIAEQCRASADFDRFQVRYLIGREQETLLDAEAREQYEGIKVRIRETRSRLWKARGYPETPQTGELTESELAIVAELRQTRRWQMAAKAKPTSGSDV